MPSKRSQIMQSVRQHDTGSELLVRKYLHAQGFRFRLNLRSLPGSPDIVLPKHKTCIFVHGCFWHRHEGCKKATTPKSNREYWLPKFELNVQRDERKTKELEESGWRVATIWECEALDDTKLKIRINEIFPIVKDSKT
jgi:DNA mismatch endonuclease (patch repair protein)